MVLNAIVTSILSMIVLFFLTKLTGNKQISQMSMFDYITGITIGSSAAEMAIGGDAFIPAFVATVLYGVAAFMISEICNKSIKARRYLNGEPMIIYLDGKFNKKNMSRARMDMGEFLTQCRNNGYFSMREIACAIMEPNGKISFLEKGKNSKEKASLAVNIVIDGKILKDNLECAKKNKWWLMKELDGRGVKLSDVLLATIENDSLFVYSYLNTESKHNIFE